MSLRKKTLLSILVVIGSLIFVLYITARFIVLNSFARLEEQEVHKNVERVLYSFYDDLANLHNTANDWAAWDDTCSFVDGSYKEYVNVNLVNTTFENLRLNLIMFINFSGELVFAKSFDLQENKLIPTPKSMQDHLSDDSPLLKHSHLSSNISGLILLEEGPMLVSSWPIRTSEDKGPIRGTLIFGRYFNSTEIKRLAEKTNLSLSMSRLDNQDLNSDQLKAYSSLSEDSPILIRPLSLQEIGGYTFLKDIYGKPVDLLSVYMPRNIYQQGRTSLFYFLVSLLVTGLVFIVMTIILLERQVLSRLLNLNNSIGNIRKSGDLSLRIPVTGDDELSSLINELNRMLEAQERSDKALRNSHQKLRSLNARLSEVEELERRRLAHQLHDMVGQNLTALGVNLNIISTELSDKEKEKTNKWFVDSRGLIKETINSIREVMADLRPFVLDDYGLPKSIDWLGRQFSDRSGVSIEVTTKEIEPRLSSEVETILFRITQESLTNILKYANATKVKISLEDTDGIVRLNIGDNGVGFDCTDIRKKGQQMGWGLIMMEERITALGGNFSITSEAGKGTQIIVEVKK